MERTQSSKIKDLFGYYRGLLIDLLEQELGDTKGWPYIRGRTLKLLSSERGLEAKVLELISKDTDSGSLGVDV